MGDRLSRGTAANVLRRHPRLALIVLNLFLALALLATGEIVARAALGYDPRYYTIVRATEREIQFPYGVVKFNTHGYPDGDFALDDPRPRVGYVGDSVTFGVGAGFGHRFSDILEQRFPSYQHMTLGSVGEGFRTRERMDRMVGTSKLLDLDLLIYFFNLNDILPIAVSEEEIHLIGDPWYLEAFHFIQANTEYLRSNSYLFNWIRYRVRVFLLRLGIEQTGYRAFERFPTESAAVISSTAQRINYLARALRDESVAFAVVLLPYEMQISAEAEKTYAGMGIHWDEEFITRGTQRRLRAALDPAIPVYDAYAAFVTRPTDRGAIAIGEFFVFDKGDSLDWNHPNRAGHRKIAEWLAGLPLFQSPTWAD